MATVGMRYLEGVCGFELRLKEKKASAQGDLEGTKKDLAEELVPAFAHALLGFHWAWQKSETRRRRIL